MLGKKSLAIALMGLGLVGSCFAADGTTATVTFNVKVIAGTCPFSVTGANEQSTINFENIAWAKDAETKKQALNFKLACGTVGVPFDTATIKASANGRLASKDSQGNSLNGEFVFYDKDQSTEWETAESVGITIEGESGGSAQDFVETKYVSFKVTPETKLGDHTAQMTYTVSYK